MVDPQLDNSSSKKSKSKMKKNNNNNNNNNSTNVSATVPIPQPVPPPPCTNTSGKSSKKKQDETKRIISDINEDDEKLMNPVNLSDSDINENSYNTRRNILHEIELSDDSTSSSSSSSARSSASASPPQQLPQFQHHPNLKQIQQPTVQTVTPFITKNTSSSSNSTSKQQGTNNKTTRKPSISNEIFDSTNQEIDLDDNNQFETPISSLSINLNKQLMLQPQKLDSNALEIILNDQIKAHLILDDKENLLVKSANDFISLFKSSSTSSSNNGSLNSLNNVSPTSTSSSVGSNSCSLSSSTATTPLSLSPQSNDDKLVKCVSIFGNTGDGKSHTLNHTFFNGRNIFCTSDKQETCTLGVWCAYDPLTKSLIFDTEGLLGSTTNENERMRLLLKVLAVSDVIIYRTRAERLHNDMFKFLSDASVAYLKYFSKELKQAAAKLKLDAISALGPCCVIFHETHHTDNLCDEYDANGMIQRTISHQIADRFAKLDLSYNAFSLIEYVGTRTYFNNPNQNSPSNMSQMKFNQTDFTKLAQRVRDLLRNNSVRQPRKLSSIYHVLKVLNDKFNGTITKNQISTFADEYFTCSSICLSCGKRCQNSINHIKDGILHENSEKCHYDHQYDNKVYVCTKCHEAGKETVVIPKTSASNDNSFVGIVKYTYSGYVLECPHHGVIYRSRQYWYGNPDPESVVRTELKHIWSGQQNNVGTSHNLSRKIIDNVSYIGESLHNVSAKPTIMAKQWIADQVNPTYWVPNSEIVECHQCQKQFVNILEKKHHCRGCGKGFCDKCSSKRKVIEWWSPTDKVRVCDACFLQDRIDEPKQLNPNYVHTSSSTNSLNTLGITGNNEIIARKVTETVSETFGLITYATKIPFDVLKESARPSYWKPDSECLNCFLCKKEFDELDVKLHHCRSCGNGVCCACSPHLRPVPSRGWETPVRVCNNCVSSEITT